MPGNNYPVHRINKTRNWSIKRRRINPIILVLEKSALPVEKSPIKYTMIYLSFAWSSRYWSKYLYYTFISICYKMEQYVELEITVLLFSYNRIVRWLKAGIENDKKVKQKIIKVLKEKKKGCLRVGRTIIERRISSVFFYMRYILDNGCITGIFPTWR